MLPVVSRVLVPQRYLVLKGLLAEKNCVSMKKNSKILLKISIVVLGLYIGTACAEVNTIGDIANTIVLTFQNVGRLMLACSYISGIGFTIASIFKFKQHRDNPTQIPVGTPIALLGIAVMLIFLPGIIKPVGFTIFGAGANLESMAGGFTGNGASSLPGK